MRRQLVARKILHAKRLHGLHIQVESASQDHKSPQDFTPVCIQLPDLRCIDHVRMGKQDFFNFTRIEVESTDDHQILFAITDIQVAVGVEFTDVRLFAVDCAPSKLHCSIRQMPRLLPIQEPGNVRGCCARKIDKNPFHHRRVVGRPDHIGKFKERVPELKFSSVHGLDPPDIQAGAKSGVGLEMLKQRLFLQMDALPKTAVNKSDKKVLKELVH